MGDNTARSTTSLQPTPFADGILADPGQSRDVPASPENSRERHNRNEETGDHSAAADLHRDADELLHKPGDRADSYRDLDGKLHRIGDREGTYRDRTFQLRDSQGWASDPTVREDIVFLSERGPAEPYEVVDPNIRRGLEELAVEAVRQESERAVASAAAKSLMKEFGVDKIDQLSERKLNEIIQDRQDRIENDTSLTDSERQAKLGRLLEMRDNAREYNRLGTEMVRTSKAMGELGGFAHTTGRPDVVVLSPFDGAVDGRDTFDIVAFTESPEATLLIDECKGGSSILGAADTEHGRAQQGSPEYGQRTAAIEKNLLRLLAETPEQMQARGVDPNGPAGQQILQARDALLRAHADGSLRVEYNLVQVARDGTIMVSRFGLERDGQPFSLEVIGGIDRARAQELVRDVETRELTQVIEIEIQQYRAAVLQSLTPSDREVVLQAVEFAREMSIEGSTTEELRTRIIETIERAKEARAHDFGRDSREIIAAYKSLEQLQGTSVGRGIDILENLNLNVEQRDAAANLLKAEIADRDRSVAASLEIADRELVAAATREIQYAQDPQRQARETLLEQTAEKVKQLEKDREQSAVPGLGQLVEAHNSLERMVAAERAATARAVELMGLTPEHALDVTAAVNNSRDQALEQMRDSIARETAQQHNLTVEQNPALRLTGGRAASFDARTYILCLEHNSIGFDREQAAFIYQVPGREPELVPYDSQAARLARAVRSIQHGLPIRSAAEMHLARVGQGVPAHEVVRNPPTAEELQMRGRGLELDRARERGTERER
ncbi:hypothetical protein [Nocardia brasiliensis]|uniref:hypothetical protein n=1 Tax=Nocardia brasiliensis TaxID=37326 RepID=UPI0002527041|nr:hypothetical protein [Nocardia brasiliensis]OCF87389.1 hypothetical protein AW168_25790 [Nocardia brasiliensis]